jgi:transcriptional regulator with XRE-family HTH domain
MTIHWQKATLLAVEPLAAHLGSNVKQLRGARGFTQQQMAKIAGVPRATWANLESGTANPTLLVLHRVASALQVSLEERSRRRARRASTRAGRCRSARAGR